jgi:hypothetical protein
LNGSNDGDDGDDQRHADGEDLDAEYSRRDATYGVSGDDDDDVAGRHGDGSRRLSRRHGHRHGQRHGDLSPTDERLLRHEMCFEPFHGYDEDYDGPRGILTSHLPDGTSTLAFGTSGSG